MFLIPPGFLIERKQIPQIVEIVRNSREPMELLEPARPPWAQGVGSSNLPAPTNRIKEIRPILATLQIPL
jgi:hypothetical protein